MNTKSDSEKDGKIQSNETKLKARVSLYRSPDKENKNSKDLAVDCPVIHRHFKNSHTQS